MIKIRLDKDKQDSLVNLHRRILTSPYKIDDNLNSIIGNCQSKSAKLKFYSFIKKEISKILFGTPDILENLLSKMAPLYRAALNENPKGLNNEIETIFDYVKFRDTRSEYGAYSLTEFLKVDVCPYCNRIPTITHIGESSSTRPQLDHWLSQEKHPYFAISLFNLIPSCGVCNTNFKKRTTFTFDDYIHPYKEGYEVEYKFSYKPKQTNDLIKTVDDFSILIKPTDNIPEKIKHKGKKTIELMEIEGTYNKHKIHALAIAKQSVLYSAEAIAQQLDLKDKRTGNPAFSGLKEYIETAFDLKVNFEDYSTQEFSKFKRDLAEDMGLVFDDEEYNLQLNENKKNGFKFGLISFLIIIIIVLLIIIVNK